MEVSGRKNGTFLYLGSDDVQDFPCSPCAKENKNVAAVKHCVECDENLCKTCLDYHNRFSVMKGHQLLDTMISPSGQRPELPSQRCDRHGGKLIDVYCPGHDKVGCSTCIAVEHGACRGITFIPDVAKHSRSTEELQSLETAINSLLSRYVTLKQKKQADLENLKQEKDQLLREIRSKRNEINDQLDKMEKELLNEVGMTYQVKLQNIDKEIKEAGDTIDSLVREQERIKAAKNENISEKYVHVKLGNEKRKFASDRIDDIERSSKTRKPWFVANNQMTSSKINIIGRVINCSEVKVESYIGEFDIKVADDANCRVFDMCLDTDGNVVMTDYSNKRIKKMNRSYTITSYLTVDDNPACICQIDSSLLAVTLINQKKVQFVSRTEPMTLKKSFAVGDRCRGIAYKNGLIYVCCGGSRERKEGAGHIEVYNITGSLLTSFYGEMECPAYVNVPNWSVEFYITDTCGLFITNGNGNMQKINGKYLNLNYPHDFCWLNRYQMCIAGYSSNNIVLMSSDGKVHDELLTAKDGIKEPISVCFDEKQSRILVSAYHSDQIKVYRLKISNK